MRLGLAFLALAGALTGVLLITWQGMAAVGHALEMAGWGGLGLMSLYHLLPLVLCALAWRTITPAPRPRAIEFAWFRFLRDAGSDLLAMVPAAGELLGVRAMAKRGVATGVAMATTVVDLTLEMSGQIIFTLIGLFVLVVTRPGDPLIRWTVLGALSLVLLAALFVLAQRCGIVRLLQRLAERLLGDARTPSVEDRIGEIYAGRAALVRALLIHTLAWLIGIGEAAIGFAMMGVAVSLPTLIVLESAIYAIRNAAFFVPAAAGVQEGSYAILGAALGIPPEFGLALSLLKRGRELILGAAALAAWHAVEGTALWRRMS
jgi:putative membrane protein